MHGCYLFGTAFSYLSHKLKKMKSDKRFFLSSLLLFVSLFTFAQKTFTEGTVVYDIGIKTGNPASKSLNSATSTVYVKGGQVRTDMSSALGVESTLYDNKAGNGVILKEYSGQKLMITLTKDNWLEKNKKYDDVVFTFSDETKTIIGYTCKKATAKLKDGSTFDVYYSPDLVPSNKDYNTTFKNLPGLAMEYEFLVGKTQYVYTVSKISFDAVAASHFDIPKAGYRTMTYEENKQIKKGE